MIEWINKKTGRRFHFRGCFKYKVNGVVVSTVTMSFGVTHKKYIDKHRYVKRFALGPIHKISGIDKQNLKNGTIEFEPVCYLGWW